MKSNPNLYDDYDDLKKWKTFIQPSIQEADLYSKEFKHIDLSGSYFLDIGFGSGGLLGWARQQGAIVSGVEIQEKLVKEARKAGIEVYKELKEVPSERYDIVTGFDLLEHLPLNEISLFLDEIMRITKPSGEVLFRFPNCQSSAGLINQFGDHTHVTMLSGPIVLHLMKNAGFIDISYQEARVMSSINLLNRVARILMKPLALLFTYTYRIAISDRNTPLSKNVILQARKPQQE
jgi:2-polyprenyl-3-methyl-5-hydroxy-6-metoxy-1,4-benzoquinol methylase